MPTAALYLELGVLPISFEIELKQFLYLKRILDKEYDDPVRMVYHTMLKYKEEINWANEVIGVRKKYNLPLGATSHLIIRLTVIRVTVTQSSQPHRSTPSCNMLQLCETS